MKTVEQWLENANYFWKKQALKNMTNPKASVKSLSEALEAAFVWADSPEKRHFWLTVKSYVEIEKAYDKKLEPTIIKAKIQALLDKGVTHVWYPGFCMTFEFLLDNPVYHATSREEVTQYAANEGKVFSDEYTFYDLNEELNNY